jgi:hypothetical protein
MEIKVIKLKKYLNFSIELILSIVFLSQILVMIIDQCVNIPSIRFTLIGIIEVLVLIFVWFTLPDFKSSHINGGFATGTIGTLNLEKDSNMHKVHLHFGGPKTGSTAIQDYLTKKADILIKKKVYYNTEVSLERNYDLINSIQSGNGLPLYEDIINNNPSMKNTFEKLLSTDKLSVISSEMFCNLSVPHLEVLKDLLGTYKCDYHISLFIRSPIDFLLSNYDQAIKRGGEHRSFSTFIDNTDLWCYYAFISNIVSVFGNKVSLFSYDKHKDNIISFFFNDILKIKVKIPNNPIIHRSLTTSERKLLLQLNKYLGPDYMIPLTDYLILNNVDPVNTAFTEISVEDLSNIISKCKEQVGEINFKYLDNVNESISIEYKPKTLDDSKDALYYLPSRDSVTPSEQRMPLDITVIYFLIQRFGPILPIN